ncbi:MAG: hypothetical protein MZW92_28435 [Comamonadaceae bacterium]|nr:hypothetical protein [Comamonadaceae bacterium]
MIPERRVRGGADAAGVAPAFPGSPCGAATRRDLTADKVGDRRHRTRTPMTAATAAPNAHELPTGDDLEFYRARCTARSTPRWRPAAARPSVSNG